MSPPSIQREMELKGEEVIVSVPPGHDIRWANMPLSRRYRASMMFTKPTNLHQSAGMQATDAFACIRWHMAKLFPEIKKNTPGEIV